MRGSIWCFPILMGLCFSAGSISAADIPLNIGLGPAAYYVPEHLEADDPEPFFGFKLHIKAVISKALIERHKGQVPEQYRKAVAKVDEARVGHLLIPDAIMLGTRKKAHGPEFYGATWTPIEVGIPIKMGPARFSLGTGLLFTYAYINIGSYKILDNGGDDEANQAAQPKYRDQVTHFFRPGLNFNADLEIQFSESFLIGMGWSSAYYVPQKIGGGIGTIGADHLEKSIWRIHEAYVMAHYRLPVEAKL